MSTSLWIQHWKQIFWGFIWYDLESYESYEWYSFTSRFQKCICEFCYHVFANIIQCSWCTFNRMKNMRIDENSLCLHYHISWLISMEETRLCCYYYRLKKQSCVGISEALDNGEPYRGLQTRVTFVTSSSSSSLHLRLFSMQSWDGRLHPNSILTYLFTALPLHHV